MKSLFPLLLSLLLLLCACIEEPELLTQPCAEGCNESASIGSPCQKAEDCATEAFCNLGFPGGYCQVFCGEGATTGDACGPENAGYCLDWGEQGAVCLGACDPNQSGDQCPHPKSRCYPVAGEPNKGICHTRCSADQDCGDGLACDGQGFCQPVVATCDGLSNQGCGEGLECFLSPNVGPFCGYPGETAPGQACTGVADCTSGQWCVNSRCLSKCDSSSFSSCGGVPSACRPLVSGTRLGFCIR